MKILKMISLLLTAALCLSSCAVFNSDRPGCAELTERLFETVPHRSGDVLYIYGDGEAGANYISPLALGRLYYPDADVVPDELDKLCDYCVYIAASGPDEPVREIHILKVRSRSDRKAIEEMASHRARILSEPDMGGPFTGAECLVFCKYEYVFLLVTGDNRSAVEIIKEAL